MVGPDQGTQDQAAPATGIDQLSQVLGLFGMLVVPDVEWIKGIDAQDLDAYSQGVETRAGLAPPSFYAALRRLVSLARLCFEPGIYGSHLVPNEGRRMV